MNTTAFAVLLLLVSSTCAAKPDEEVVRAMTKHTTLTPEMIGKDYDACDSGVTLRMKICASYKWVEQDVRMNRAYQRVLVAAKRANSQDWLVRAQRAWISYREQECTFEGVIGAGGGSLEGLYVLSCKEQLTRQRAERLEEVAEEQERR